MTRTKQEIETTMDVAQASKPNLSVLNKAINSVYQAWKGLVASTVYDLEVNFEQKVAEMEAIAARSAPCSDEWLKHKTLDFQYDSATPQIVQQDPETFATFYNPVDVTKRIITRAAVETTSAGVATVKVAKSDPPEILTADELAGLQAYLHQNSGIGFVGMRIIASSANPDRLYIKGTIYFDGQYGNAIIKTNVIAAINQYLKAIPFNSIIRVTGLTDAIQKVPGVTDLKLEDVAMRSASETFTGPDQKHYLTQGYDLLLPNRATIAGYITEENTTGETFADRLTFTAI